MAKKVFKDVAAAKSLSKLITFLIGVISMFLAGVLYMIMSDLSFGNTSVWLIIATLLSFGGAICFFFSNNFLEKPVVMYVMRGIGLALSVGFVIFLHCFHNTEYFVGKIEGFINEGLKGEGALAASKATMIISYIFAYIGMVAQAANVVLVAVLKED
ncbi:MAG: hypothetical protein NC132_03800 [Corallococcus sp.]|nr:hypothetical protein [Corallococcus sp.]MCM1359624.1 hypothetical protein [Corallococcus sp.]MCM1395216.1 hypothetical protein [Corallococcus sp.]